jgi:hypothetical protein
MCPWNSLLNRWRRALHVAFLVLLGIIVHATSAGAGAITSMYFHDDNTPSCLQFALLSGPGTSVGGNDTGNCVGSGQLPPPGTILNLPSNFVPGRGVGGTFDGITLIDQAICSICSGGLSAGMISSVDISVRIPDVVPLGVMTLQGVASSRAELLFLDLTFDGRYQTLQNINFIGTGTGTVTIRNFGPSNGNIDYQILESSAVLTAVPEPSTVLLLASGLAGILGHGWRRKGAA